MPIYVSEIVDHRVDVWLACKTCGRPLVPISVYRGKTYLTLFGDQVRISEAFIRCECGADRYFQSKKAGTPAGKAGGHV